MKNFGLIGAAGFVAPRHFEAIKHTGNQLIAAVDPHDSVGVLDNTFPEARFFTEIERFDRFLNKRQRGPESEKIHYVSICSPNYLHDAHARMALRSGANAICEKPLVTNPWNLDALEEIEHETGQRVFTVFQLRLNKSAIALKERISKDASSHDVILTYITRRGCWFHRSWKGSDEKSGGLLMNVGIHFFDLLIWIFGAVRSSEVHYRTHECVAGVLCLARARVRWFLSVAASDLPPEVQERGGYAYRSLVINGVEVELSNGFVGSHTRVYETILAGHGCGIADARPSIEGVYQMRYSKVSPGIDPHPHLALVRPGG